tara:strand:+ start:681 stop:2306 length:1626 start_codon:yes stop_codon:yes gene_type:complete
MSDADLKILDCTLRDGGYYNDWDFSKSLVDQYLITMDNSNVDVIEIGFRFLPKKSFLGPYAYTTDQFLQSLDLPEDLMIGVMINAKEILDYQHGIKEAIRALFNKEEDSPVSLVRIAAHFSEYKNCHEIVSELNGLGYKVGFNLMQAGGRSTKELCSAANDISKWSELDVLYFADSLGNMRSDDVQKTINSFKEGGWSKPIGIHTHDNMGEALNNSIEAIANGASWIDSTVLGMGRGPGNVRTEYLLIELQKRNLGKYVPDNLFPLVLDEFTELQKHYGWGPNLLYYLSAEYGIHPTYVQEMSGRVNMDAQQQVEALNYLNSTDSSGFSRENLSQAFLNEGGNQKGSWSCENWLLDETVLIIGPGPSTKKHAEAIHSFITEKKPKVISLNINNDIKSEHIDAYAACHHMRVFMDAEKYLKLEKPLIIPLETVPNELRKKLSKVQVLDYGMSIKDGHYEFSDEGCTIPNRLVFGYVISLIHSAKAKRIFLAGFDGYGKNDPRQEEMEKMIELYKRCENSLELTAITPSSYSVEQSSVYNLSL